MISLTWFPRVTIRIIDSPDRNRFLRGSVKLAAAVALSVGCGHWQIATAQTKTATSTTLTITSGTSSIPVSTAPSGSVIALTATVTSGSTPLTVGQVNFCDAAAEFCSDIHLLGTAQLTPAGIASFKFVPGPGSHSYKAIFLGTNNAGASTSGTVGLTVTGLYPSVTSIVDAVGDVLQVAVGGAGPSVPTGTVSFLDATNGNAVLGAASVVEVLGLGGVGPINFANSATYPFDSSPVIGDFNGDGIPDLVEGTGTVLLGNGDGTFSTLTTDLPLAEGYGSGIVAGDFNGDGKLDLVVSASDPPGNDTTVTALLGNGDGTFSQGASETFTGEFDYPFAVADFNGDGIPDLVLSVNGGWLVQLGKGDGTFVTSQSGDSGNPMAVGDFNNDGIPDIVLAPGTLLLGRGDGTFTVTTAPLPANAIFAAVGDFNGDGNPDLAVVNHSTPPR
jgi:hypothetical protein